MTYFLKWQKLLHDTLEQNRFCGCFCTWYASNFNSYFTKDFTIWTVSQGFNFTLSSSERDFKKHNCCVLIAPYSCYIQLFHSINRYSEDFLFPPPTPSHLSSNELSKREEEERGTITFHPLLKYQRVPHAWKARRVTWKLPWNWMLYLWAAVAQ